MVWFGFRLIVFNATFNNISVISRRAVSFIGGGNKVMLQINLCFSTHKHIYSIYLNGANIVDDDLTVFKVIYG
jgi:hypothetical protein